MSSILIQSPPAIVIKDPNGTLRIASVAIGGNEELPPLAGIAGSVLVEDPVGTLVFRQLLQSDILADFAINTFSATTAVIEVGASAVTPAFTASYVRTPDTATLTDDEGSAAKDVSGTPTSFTSNETFTKTTNNDSVQFTLSATEGSQNDSANTNISWQPRTFYGVDVDGLSSEADIESLANQQLDNNRNITFTVTAGASQHIYYAFPSSYGTPTFTIGGFEGGFVLQAGAVSVTNGFGVTQNYDLWKSVNANLGTTTVVVT